MCCCCGCCCVVWGGVDHNLAHVAPSWLAVGSISLEDVEHTLQYLGVLKSYRGQASVCVTPDMIDKLAATRAPKYALPAWILVLSHLYTGAAQFAARLLPLPHSHARTCTLFALLARDVPRRKSHPSVDPRCISAAE